MDEEADADQEFANGAKAYQALKDQVFETFEREKKARQEQHNLLLKAAECIQLTFPLDDDRRMEYHFEIIKGLQKMGHKAGPTTLSNVAERSYRMFQRRKFDKWLIREHYQNLSKSEDIISQAFGTHTSGQRPIDRPDEECTVLYEFSPRRSKATADTDVIKDELDEMAYIPGTDAEDLEMTATAEQMLVSLSN